jgi:tryptophanyl-tRNA synthetase
MSSNDSLAGVFPPRAVSGIEPRARLRIGTYLTILSEQIRLQHEYPGDAFFVIADYHALTQSDQHSRLGDQALEMARAYCLVGLDSSKAVLYRQSSVPELFELLWILACIAPVTLPSSAGGVFGPSPITSNIATALYPLLMAADALGLRATTAAGADFDSDRFEYVSVIANRLNERFGEILFPVVYYRVTTPSHVRLPPAPFTELAQGPPVFGEDGDIASWISTVASCAMSSEAPSELWIWLMELYKRAVEPERHAATLAAHPETSPHEAGLRREMVAGISEHFAAMRQRRRKAEITPDGVEDLLRTGAERARREFSEAVKLLRERIGFGAYQRRGLAPIRTS